MRRIVLHTGPVGAPARLAFERLADFTSWADHCEEVLKVEEQQEADGTHVTHWEVAFRRGRLHWSEYDDFDSVNRRISFRYRDGDPEDFHGQWDILPSGEDDATILLVAVFDLGFESYSDVVAPIAEETMQANMARILRGLFGQHLEIRATVRDLDERDRPGES